MIGESPFAHLRPTTTPEMLDRAYTVVVRFWPVLLGGAALYGSDHLLPLIAPLLRLGSGSDPWRVGVTLSLALLGDFAAAIALLAVFQGLIFPLRPISPKAILRTALRKFPGYFLSHLAYVIIVAFGALTAWAFLQAWYFKGQSGGQLSAGIATAAATFYCGIRFSLAAIACLIEDGTPFSSFRRSWQLTMAWPRRASFRQKERPVLRWVATVLLPVAIGVCVVMIGYGIGVFWMGVSPPGSAAAARAAAVAPPGVVPSTTVMMEAIAFCGVCLALPFYWAGLMAIYVEYRMRREALDFYLRIRELSREVDSNYAAESS